jgi:protease PrsW
VRLPVPPLPPRLRALGPLAVGVLLAVCGLVVLLLVRRETGSEGFAVGLALAALPVPFLVGAFRWLDGVAPKPWRHLAFAFAWGACAATLAALLVNGLLVRLLTGDDAVLAPASSDPLDTLELTVIAPVVEEAAKAAAVVLLFLHRPHSFHGVLSGIAAAGVTASGFAFTENVLYLGSAVTQDRASDGVGSTVAAFFIRIVMAPFAHPVFTALTGVGLGLAAALGPGAPGRRVWRVALPVLGLAAAMGLHSAWNASTSLSFFGFAAVYGLLMLPVFVLLTWVAVWSRVRELRTVREALPQYAAAGWLYAAEPSALGSPRARSGARRIARKDHGWAGLRAVAGYQATATSLALLRRRAERGTAGPGFVARERALLARLWELREVAAAPTLAAEAEQRRLAREEAGEDPGERCATA